MGVWLSLSAQRTCIDIQPCLRTLGSALRLHTSPSFYPLQDTYIPYFYSLSVLSILSALSFALAVSLSGSFSRFFVMKVVHHLDFSKLTQSYFLCLTPRHWFHSHMTLCLTCMFAPLMLSLPAGPVVKTQKALKMLQMFLWSGYFRYKDSHILLSECLIRVNYQCNFLKWNVIVEHILELSIVYVLDMIKGVNCSHFLHIWDAAQGLGAPRLLSTNTKNGWVGKHMLLPVLSHCLLTADQHACNSGHCTKYV